MAVGRSDPLSHTRRQGWVGVGSGRGGAFSTQTGSALRSCMAQMSLTVHVFTCERGRRGSLGGLSERYGGAHTEWVPNRHQARGWEPRVIQVSCTLGGEDGLGWGQGGWAPAGPPQPEPAAEER